MARRDNANEYSLFINLVSEEDRKSSETALARVQVGTFEAVAEQAHLVLQALLGGKLPPSIAQEARGLLEVQMMAAAAAANRDNPQPKQAEGMSVTLNLLNALEQHDPDLNPQYTKAAPAIPAVPETTALPSTSIVIESIEDIEDLS